MKPSAGLVVSACLWAIAVINCAAPQPSSRNENGHSGAPSPSPPISVSAGELLDDYERNEIAADNRYKDRLLTVTGRVDKVGKDIAGTMYVTLAGKSDSDFSLFTVQCLFDDSWAVRLGTLSPGDRVSLTGTCDGKFGNVLLKDCRFN